MQEGKRKVKPLSKVFFLFLFMDHCVSLVLSTIAEAGNKDAEIAVAGCATTQHSCESNLFHGIESLLIVMNRRCQKDLY